MVPVRFVPLQKPWTGADTCTVWRLLDKTFLGDRAPWLEKDDPKKGLADLETVVPQTAKHWGSTLRFKVRELGRLDLTQFAPQSWIKSYGRRAGQSMEAPKSMEAC